MSEYTNRISDYLSGGMSPEEKIKFEADLLKMPELKEEYQLTIMAKEIFVGEPDLERIQNDPNLHKAEELVKEWMTENNDENLHLDQTPIEEKKLPGFKSYRISAWIYLAAASIVIAFLLFKSFVLPHRAEKIFLSFYESIDPAKFETPDIPAEALVNYREALEYFESEDYTSAAASLTSLYQYEKENADILLMLGISEMESGELNKALKLFEEVSALDGANVEYASFYSGLCYVRLGDPRAAIIYLADVTGLTQHLDKSSQKMIRRVYLIYTFQFKQLRKEMSKDEEPTGIIGPTQRRIFIGAVISLFLIIYLTVIVANRTLLRNKRNWLWLTVIFFLPIAGSTIYLLKFRKKTTK